MKLANVFVRSATNLDARRPFRALVVVALASGLALSAGCSDASERTDDAGTLDGDPASELDASSREGLPEASATIVDAASTFDARGALPTDAQAEPRADAAPADAGDGGATPIASPGGTRSAPATWKEHWFEHEQTLTLVDENEWVALYFDDDVNRAQAEWILPFMTRVWKYTVEHYGQFTDGKRDGRLYAIYHQGKYSGGHPSTYFDGSHDYRNVSDVGPGPYPDGSYAISTHEVAHVIEGASRSMHGSPAFGLWKDSKWAEFFQYDLYVGLGLTREASRVFDEFSKKSDDFPRPGTYWFRDWFYPLWKEHGGVEVMANYFRLLAQHFRKNGVNFGSGMNYGEFVHFMSGAARTNLKAQAEKAFGWSEEREAEFTRARTDFPNVRY